MRTYRDAAVALRAVKLGEADRIVTLLTREHGCVRAVARGVRRTSSRMGGRLEPGSVVDIQCYRGRNLDTVTQVVTVANYGARLASDYPRWTTAQAMIETAERLALDSDRGTSQQFHLLVGALGALSGHRHDPGLTLDSYLLRALAVGGWSPSFDACAGCGRPGPHRDFHMAQGGSVCPGCSQPGASRPAQATLDLLGALLVGDWDAAERSDARSRREAAGVTAAYLQWHLDRRIRSLRLVER